MTDSTPASEIALSPAKRLFQEKALQAFAEFWPKALKNARVMGLTKSGLDIRTATELSRNVWVAAWNEGGATALRALLEEMEQST